MPLVMVISVGTIQVGWYFVSGRRSVIAQKILTLTGWETRSPIEAEGNRNYPRRNKAGKHWCFLGVSNPRSKPTSLGEYSLRTRHTGERKGGQKVAGQLYAVPWRYRCMPPGTCGQGIQWVARGQGGSDRLPDWAWLPAENKQKPKPSWAGFFSAGLCGGNPHPKKKAKKRSFLGPFQKKIQRCVPDLFLVQPDFAGRRQYYYHSTPWGGGDGARLDWNKGAGWVDPFPTGCRFLTE